MNLDVSDAELVRRAQAGEQGSLETLMDCVRTRVYSHIRRLIRDEHESEDLTQETLLRILRSLGRLRRIERFWSWVFQIATNMIRQHYRNTSRHRAVCLSSISDNAFEKHEAGWLGASSSLEDKERRDMLLLALSGVDESHRLVLILRFFSDIPYAEAACLLGCSRSHARVALFRAKRALRRVLTRGGYIEMPQAA